MYCPKCGKENPGGARFCMHCGADLSEYTVEVAPKIEVSPKISVSAKAEGGLALKWKKKPEKCVKVLQIPITDKEWAWKYRIKEDMEVPVYKSERQFSRLDDKPFCPLCGNYDCLKEEEEIYEDEDGVMPPDAFEKMLMDGFELKVSESGGGKEFWAKYKLHYCLACNHAFLTDEHIVSFHQESRADTVAPCEFCKVAAGIYKCYDCGKRICENCTVIKVVKKGLFSKETIKLCPNCAKEK